MFELVLTPENGWDNGTSSLFENGAYADTIKLLKDSSKEREQQHKLNQRIKLTAKFKTNDKISRKISATESVNGTVTSVDYENGRVAILLDNSKKCNIFPDSLTLLN